MLDIVVRYCAMHPKVRKIRQAIGALNGLQNYFHYIADELGIDEGRWTLGRDELSWRDAFQRCSDYSSKRRSVVYVIEAPFDDNWFSHEEEHISVITTSDWEEHYAPPALASYLCYQIAQASLCFEAELTEDMELRLVHETTNGCMFDMCEYKKDIRIGMSAGVICPSCKATLRMYGTGEEVLDAVRRILRYVRQDAVGMRELVRWNAAFVVMRFTEFDENAHAYEYGIQPALKDVGLACVRADENPPHGTILDSVCKGIRSSRFVIVKVDEQNLNVFFELGYALGLDKDVLLISEQSLIGHLPTDLNNWTCLTYTKGDYKGLRNAIVNFFKDKYRIA